MPFQPPRSSGGASRRVGISPSLPSRPATAVAPHPPPRSHVRPRPASTCTSSSSSSARTSTNTSNNSSGNPIWVKISVLEHYLHSPSSADNNNDDVNGSSSAVGAAARRKFGRNRRFSPGASLDSPSSSGGGGREDRSDSWGWVRAWAVPCSSTAGSQHQATADSRYSNSIDDRPPTAGGSSSAGPASPFGHVKLHRVGSAASPRFANERQSSQGRQQQQFSDTSISSRPAPHRSNSSPIPLHKRQDMENDDKPVQAMTVTIRDADCPAYDGQTVTLSSEHVKDGTAPANSWWASSSSSTSAGRRQQHQLAMPPDDLIQLTHLHEPAVVHCLRTRYDEGLVYTNTGPILLACNPFRMYDGLYSEQTMKRYWEAGSDGGVSSVEDESGRSISGCGGKLPPHVYGVADEAFRAMMRAFEDGIGRHSDVASDAITFADQSILVSGESGAGKTVTTKIVMRYLAALSQRCASGAASSSHSASGGIEQQVLQSNPILESFGNARTVRNDNSSRFGKFIEIQFQQSGTLTGAKIETYLLEKVRLITQSPGERNFHIFYEILADCAASQSDKTALGLRHATSEDFAMTCASGTFDRRDGVNDADTYQDLKDAMVTVGFTAEEQLDILSVPAALLFCSNLSFLDGASHDGSSQLDGSNPSLPNALHLLGVTADMLNDAMCTSTIKVAGENLRKVLSRDQATKALEAFMMATYGALFRYIVDRVNRSITVGTRNGASAPFTFSDDTAFISVLDIFGFESFKSNSFEQLCINYCNEALQQQFNRFVFKLEQQEYEREGIEWAFIEFPDNQEVLDLIEKKHTGIISILDEQCRLTKCTDQSFVSKTYEICADHPRFLGSDRAKAIGCFSVHHYAGPVEYNSESFLAKNKDELPKESTDLLLSSSRPILRKLGEMLSALSPVSPSSSTGGNGFPKRSSSSLSRASVGSQFSSQLRQLRERIEQTAPHYVRCLKPNDDLVPDNFVPAIIADQLRCAGVLEAVRVSRVGFPQRYVHSLFVQRYGILGGHTFDSARRRQRHDLCYVLVDAIVPQIWNYQHGHKPGDQGEEFAHDLLSVGVQIGKTKVFLRQRAFEALERNRAEKLDREATKIQSAVRMYFYRDSFVFILESAIMIQTVFRGYRARRFADTVRYHHLATLIQRTWRGFIAFDDYNNTRFIAIWCQRLYRGSVARRKYAIISEDRKAIVLQSFWRMCIPYRRFRAVIRLVINLQQIVRSWRARTILKQLKFEARNLDLVAQERDELRREALRAKQELEELRRRSENYDRLQLQASGSNSVDHGGLSSIASSQLSVVYRNFPKTPTAQAEEIKALADACTAKDIEMERLRQELESIKEEKDNDFQAPPIKTVFAKNNHSASEENSSPDTPAATEAESTATPSSLGPNGSPSKLSKRGLMMGRLDLLMGRPGNSSSTDPAGSIASGASRQSKLTSTSLLDSDANDKSYLSDSPRKYSIQQNDSREMKAYAPVALDSSFNDEMEETPLHHAIRASNVDALLDFIDSCDDVYAYINESGHQGRTPLHLAVLKESLEMISLLLEHYAVANLQDNAGNTPLHYAEDWKTIELLLAKGGANPNIPNGDGLCALHLAVRRKDFEGVRHLLAHGADVAVADDIRWCTPLHLVAQSDSFSKEYLQSRSSTLSPSGEIAQMLCEATEPSEPDLNYQDRDGNTPLHHAAVLEEDYAQDLISIFLRYGSDPNMKNERGQTPMHLICHNKGQRNHGTYRRLLESFLSYGGDPNIPSLNGCNPIHLCLYHKDVDSAVQLIQAGGQLHMPWKKPQKWNAFWAETGLPEVFCTDMITNQGDLRRILSAISTKQEKAPKRPTCMRCMSSFGSFSKRYHCAHCSSLICRSCSSANVDSTELPAFCRDSDSNTMVCSMCEDIVLSRLGNEF